MEASRTSSTRPRRCEHRFEVTALEGVGATSWWRGPPKDLLGAQLADARRLICGAGGSKHGSRRRATSTGSVSGARAVSSGVARVVVLRFPTHRSRSSRAGWRWGVAASHRGDALRTSPRSRPSSPPTSSPLWAPSSRIGDREHTTGEARGDLRPCGGLAVGRGRSAHPPVRRPRLRGGGRRGAGRSAAHRVDQVGVRARRRRDG